MRNKLNYLTKVSLNRKIKTKWFVIANIILAVLLIGVINIDSIISFFGGDFDEAQKIHVVDNTGASYDLFKDQVVASVEQLKSVNSSFDYEIDKTNMNIEEAKNYIKNNKKDIIIVINNNEKDIVSSTIVSEGYIDAIKYQVISSSINSVKSALVVNNLGISMDEFNKIYSPATIERIYLDESKSSEDESMETIMTTVFPVVVLPFFMLTIFLVQMIGAEVNDEKTTRGMEIIISNVSPKTHFFSKVIAGNVFVLLQGLLLLVFSGTGLLLRKMLGGDTIISGLGGQVTHILDSVLKTNLAGQLIYIIPLTVLLMVITFISYSLLAGILASVTTNTEDFQQVQTPLMIVLLIGYYLAMMAGMFKGALFIRILSYVPLISAILSPSLLVLGQIGIIDVLVSVAITAGFNYLLVKYGLKIYKVGILNYSSKDLWKKMFKALKNKEN